VKKALSLKELKSEREKAIRDFQLMQRQLIGAETLIKWLNLKIRGLEANNKQEVLKE